MIAAVGRRFRPAARRRQATRTASARSSTARRRQREKRLHTLWCGGRPGGSRRQAQPSRARCHKAWSMISVDQSRGRPTREGGSYWSIVAATRASVPWRTISCTAGSYLRRSSAVHAILVVLWSGSTRNGADGRCVRSERQGAQRVSFRQALSDPSTPPGEAQYDAGRGASPYSLL